MNYKINGITEWAINIVVISIPVCMFLFFKEDIQNDDHAIVLLSLVFLMGNIPLYVILWKRRGHISITLFDKTFVKTGKTIILYNLICILVIVLISINIPILISYLLLALFLIKLLENFSKNNSPNNFGIAYSLFILIFNIEIVFYKELANSSYNFLATLPNISTFEIAYGALNPYPNLIFSLMIYFLLYSTSLMKNTA